jgi:hypothetical protein
MEAPRGCIGHPQDGPKRNAKERHGAGALVHTTHATASSSGCSKLEIGEDGSGEGEVQSAIGTKTALQLCQDRREKMTRGRDCEGIARSNTVWDDDASDKW